jgi:hypothetical protein
LKAARIAFWREQWENPELMGDLRLNVGSAVHYDATCLAACSAISVASPTKFREPALLFLWWRLKCASLFLFNGHYKLWLWVVFRALNPFE